MASKLNKARVRAYVLGECQRQRPHLGIRRVSAETFAYLERVVEQAIDKLVQVHPSRGVTFMPPVNCSDGNGKETEK